MFDVPKIIDLKVSPDNSVLLYFDSGIIKRIDIASFGREKKEGFGNIELCSGGLLVNGKTISTCDLWSLGKFCGWNKLTKT